MFVPGKKVAPPSTARDKVEGVILAERVSLLWKFHSETQGTVESTGNDQDMPPNSAPLLSVLPTVQVFRSF